jgi:Na+/H+-translocating membrane pyrophosphatase
VRCVGNLRRSKRLANGEIEFTKDFKPDYRACVDIVTAAALREMVLPGALVVLMPIVVGVLFKLIYTANGGGGAKGSEVVAGLLMVGTIAGILMALFLNNTGGAWDNAKNMSSQETSKMKKAWCIAKSRTRTKPLSWAIPSATRSRTRQDLRSMC